MAVIVILAFVIVRSMDRTNLNPGTKSERKMAISFTVSILFKMSVSFVASCHQISADTGRQADHRTLIPTAAVTKVRAVHPCVVPISLSHSAQQEEQVVT